MSDTRLEERLRSALHGEADGLPLTITPAELERRLAARRRDRNGRRLTLMAAAVAAVAVGGIVALTNGWLQLPASGSAPSPAPVASLPPDATGTPAPSQGPAASSTASPAIAASPSPTESIPCTVVPATGPTPAPGEPAIPPDLILGNAEGDAIGYLGHTVAKQRASEQSGDPSSWDDGLTTTGFATIPLTTDVPMRLLGDGNACIVGVHVDMRPYGSTAPETVLASTSQTPAVTIDVAPPPVGKWTIRVRVDWQADTGTASTTTVFVVDVTEPTASAGEQLPCSTIDSSKTLLPPGVMAGVTPGDSMGYDGHVVGTVGNTTSGDPRSWETGPNDQAVIPMTTTSTLVLQAGDGDACITGASASIRPYQSSGSDGELPDVNQAPSRTIALAAPPVGKWIVQAHVAWAVDSGSMGTVSTFIVDVSETP